jgi:UDP-glucose 4-epimerase
MKVFVTGGAGYVGSVTVEHLIRNGHSVTVFDNLERGHAAAVHPSAQLRVGDLRNKEEVVRAVAECMPDAIIHFAAYAYVGESMAKPLEYFENNVSGSLNLIVAAKSAGVDKFIFSSSCATYGLSQALPVTEETPQHPINPYGESKLIVERMLRWAQRIHGIDVVILRYFNACGATETLGEDHSPETHAIPLALQSAADVTRVFRIFGTQYDTPDRTCIRDYVHVKDLAQAHLLALEPGLNLAVNLGGGQGASVREVLDAVQTVTGRKVNAFEDEARAGDPPVLIADNRQARQKLGWIPEHSALHGIVSDAWKWMCRNPHGYTDGHEHSCTPTDANQMKRGALIGGTLKGAE